MYAQWYAPYTISYNANGGTGAPGNQTKVYNTNLKLTTSTPTREGYTFSHWNTNANGTGSTYLPGGVYAANNAATLYAQWIPRNKINVYDESGNKRTGLVSVYNANGEKRECIIWAYDANGVKKQVQP